MKRRQRGVIFYLFAVAMLAVLASFALAVARLGGGQDPIAHERRLLERARDVALAAIAQQDQGAPATGSGSLRGLLDLPVAAGSPGNPTEPNLDGLADDEGCAWRGWTPGQGMRLPGASGDAVRCFGRMAWRSLGLATAGTTDADPAGQIPWLVASANLSLPPQCLAFLDPARAAGSTAPAGCPATPPHPWLGVVDARGNPLSDQVAFAVLLPGPALAGQIRDANAPLAAWLDQLTVEANCRAPCRPGSLDNAGYSHADGQPWVLVAELDPTVARLHGDGWRSPLNFNDRLTYVTVPTLFERLRRSP